MSQWYLAKDGDVLIHNNKGLTVSDRIPYIDIQCPQGYDPEAESCGKPYGHWSLVDSGLNVWRFECKFPSWHDLFYNNRGYGGDFRYADGEFRCVGSGNTDLIYQMDGLFRDCDGLVSCVTIDTHNCFNLSAMFSTCRHLKKIPYLDTSYNMDFNSFAVDCDRLEEVDERIDTSNGRSFYWMFHACPKLVKIPTIDLRNADDTWRSEHSPYLGNWGILDYCSSLPYAHLIGGAGITDVTAIIDCESNKVCDLQWDYCYLPLVTGVGNVPGTDLSKGSWAPNTTFKSISSVSLPNLDGSVAANYIPKAVHLGDVYIPNASGSGSHRPTGSNLFSSDMESAGQLTLTPSEADEIRIFENLFNGLNKLTQFPNLYVPTLRSTSQVGLFRMFYGMTNVGSGSYAFYQELISKGYGSFSHYETFTNCGINTQEGAADLAKIPSDWK